MPKQAAAIPIDLVLKELWYQTISISPNISFTTVYAVNSNNCIEVKQAVEHPNLERPIVFLAEHDVMTVFTAIKHKRVADAIDILCLLMHQNTAKKILVFLWQHALIDISR
jgi:hypothetical protein